ncbi:MAG: DUF3089 domain-containing protein [Bacteroidia bacterium]
MAQLSFRNSLILLFISLSIVSCQKRPSGLFSESPLPAAPDYSDDANWAALPWTEDQADQLPDSNLIDIQANAEVDVFFLHPTSYTYKKGNTNWNGAIDDSSLNKRTEESAIKYQASIFNGVGRVFAPRYRQAHIHAYFEEKNRPEAIKAFKLAFGDVAKAFSHYLKHHNQGRPIIIAGHSQGSTHSILLLKHFFDGKPLQDQLVAAYLVGMPVTPDTFKTIPPCTSKLQTGCYCTWRTIKRKKSVDWIGGEDVTVTNPLSWRTDNVHIPPSRNRGGVFPPFRKITPETAGAQATNDGFLWARRPRFPWSFLWTARNFHIADYNIYYIDVRKNAQDRAEAFLQNED